MGLFLQIIDRVKDKVKHFRKIQKKTFALLNIILHPLILGIL